jgi:hypothetical protein
MKIKLPKLIRKNVVSKRQRFAIGVFVLSGFLFLAEHFLGKAGLYAVSGLGILTDLFLYWALRRDMKDYFSPQVFIVPLLYTLAFGFFYFSLPPRLLVQLFLTVVYAVGLYSAFLSENIFIVSGIRTIALLSSARTVSFILSIFIYAFFTNTLFSSGLPFFIMMPLVFIYSLLLIAHSLWTYTLTKSLRTELRWATVLSICLVQLALLLWLWPSKPLIVALFLTDIFYTIVGLSHLWFEKRLFRGVVWEYIWFAGAVFAVLVFFTSWA